MSIIGIGLDILLAVLLVTALVFGWRLERKLKALKNGQEAFAQAVRELDAAARRAEAGLSDLRAATDEVHDSLHDRILKARELKQQLDVHLARSERIPAERTPAPPRDVVAAIQNLAPPPELERPATAYRVPPPPPRPAPRRFDDELFASAADERPRGYS